MFDLLYSVLYDRSIASNFTTKRHRTDRNRDTQTTERRHEHTRSKQRDRYAYGVTHTTHRSDSQPSHSDSTGR